MGRRQHRIWEGMRRGCLRWLILTAAVLVLPSEGLAQCIDYLKRPNVALGYRDRTNNQKITYCEGQTARPAVAKGDARCRPIGFYSRCRRLSPPRVGESWTVNWSPGREAGVQQYVIRAEATANQSNYRLDCESRFESTVFDWPCDVMAEIVKQDQHFSTSGVHMTVAERGRDQQLVFVPARIASDDEDGHCPPPVRLVLLVSEKSAVAKLVLERISPGEPGDEPRTFIFDPPVSRGSDGTCSIYLHPVPAAPAEEQDTSPNVKLVFNGDTWKVTPYLASDRQPLKQGSFLIRLLEVPQG